MSRIFKGSAVLRSLVFVLGDGNPVVQWTNWRVQELLTGQYRDYEPAMFGRPIMDSELEHLKTTGAVEHFTRQYVWLTAMLEDRGVDHHEIEPVEEKAYAFYLLTNLPEQALEKLRERIARIDEASGFGATLYNGQVAVAGAGGKPFDNADDAENARRVIRGILPASVSVEILFAEGADARKATNEMLSALVEDTAPALSFDELAASQSVSPMTEGKCAVVLSSDIDNANTIWKALQATGMQLVAASSLVEAWSVIAANTQIEGCEPVLCILDLTFSEQSDWRDLPQYMKSRGQNMPEVIVLANAETADPVYALALKEAGAHVLLDYPINESRLRLHVYEVLQAHS
ncbi:MAG: hypothetical protein UZ15_CFX003002391 [Chloroflexi bacterium OLB15]|nr:MAG: hypothetical protein UZ15_CFX003002391 [Chloroflexi bacterium OLB15]